MKKWYALYVKMHHEKKIAQRLCEQGIEHFLPLQTVVRQWSDRKKKIEQVVIPMMVFVHIEESERITLLQDPSALSYLTLRSTRQPAVIPEKEMNQFIFMFDYSESSINFYQDILTPGCKVRVVKGPLQGLEGELIQQNGKHEVGILIPQLGYASVEIPVGFLRRIEE